MAEHVPTAPVKKQSVTFIFFNHNKKKQQAPSVFKEIYEMQSQLPLAVIDTAVTT